MKSIKLIVIILLFTVNSIFALTTDPANKTKTVVSTQVQKLLEKPNFLINKDMKVIVKLTINKNNEIVVLHVESNDTNNVIEGYIKSRLNYKKLTKKLSTQVYTLPIKLLASK